MWTDYGHNERNNMTILELAQQVGLHLKRVSATNGGEYHSNCVVCGGKDRFFIQPFKQMEKCLGFYCCRRCGICGDSIQFAREFLNYSYQEALELLGTMVDVFKPIYYRSNFTLLSSPPDKWIENATEFVKYAHENILQNVDALTYLFSRGLPLEAVQKYKLGWSNSNEYIARSEWGMLDEIKENGTMRKLWIPKGLVIPYIEKDKVKRLKVRRSDYHADDKLPKYVVISGGMNGLTIVGSPSKTVVVVESELDAYAIHYAMNGLICVIAVGSNIKNPDVITDRIVKESEQILVCHDNDEAGHQMLKKWKKLYDYVKAYPVPFGKDIGEAVEQGLNIKEWLSSAVKI